MISEGEGGRREREEGRRGKGRRKACADCRVEALALQAGTNFETPSEEERERREREEDQQD
jgi:hypothetical protein